MKSKIIVIKTAFYLIILFLLSFLPSNNFFLQLFSKQPHVFNSRQKYSFTPQPLPYLQNFYLEPLTAQAYLIIDSNSFTPVLEHNSQTTMLPASTVKLATALVAFNHYDLNQILRVKTVIEEELKMGLVKNEQISVINLLYGTLTYSANDAAYTLAENFPGGVNNFVKKMNSVAQKYHLENTHFTNPIGFDDSNQYTTAIDLAKLSRAFINNKTLLSIASTKSITVSDVDYKYFHYLYNINELLGNIPYIGGLKTGTTEKAGQNLITYYKWQNRPLIIVVLKSQERFEDAKKLIELVKTNLRYQELPKIVN